jgi:hypothetical protein
VPGDIAADTHEAPDGQTSKPDVAVIMGDDVDDDLRDAPDGGCGCRSTPGAGADRSSLCAAVFAVLCLVRASRRKR